MKTLNPHWRSNLPKPRAFYAPLLKDKGATNREWVSLTCVFHEDKKPSLSVNLDSGGFVCHACGAKGRDIVDFYRQRRNVGFVEAIEQIGNGAHA